MLLLGIDHVAITVANLEASCAFYDSLFGISTLNDHRIDGRPIVRVIIVGGGVRLSIHQAGNGVDLVAAKPTVGSVDICLRWSASIAEAVAFLRSKSIAIIDGPSPRRTADDGPAESVYFRDLDGNLVELIAADWE
jgi:catechol 2,3-dioxygenase-like lactoylglutathione lyase family enzyme